MYKKIIFTSLSLIVIMATGCTRETLVGEKTYFVSSNPLLANTALTVNHALIDFNVNNKLVGTALSFSAAFNTDVSWKIVIQGKASHAVREIKGTGTVIDNTNAVWEGDATSTVFFRKGDSCTASLYVQGIDTAISSAKLVIDKLMSYHKRTVDNVRYLLVEDFDGNHMGTAGMKSVSLDMADLGSPAYAIASIGPINGSSAFHMNGIDYNNNGWIASMNHTNLNEMVSATVADNVASTTPENFYINLYIRGTGKPNSAIALKIYEYDAATSPQNLVDVMTDANFVFTTPMQGQNDGWVSTVGVTWEGWKLVSVPFSEFRVDNDLTKGGAGNHIKEPWKICAMAVSLLSDPQYGGDVAADVDYIILSEGGPFVPKY